MQRPINAQIIVPCLNEEISIPAFLNELENFRRQLLLNPQTMNLVFDFIFVDNGSTDRSHALLSQHCLAYPNDRIIVCLGKGYGRALKEGFKQASAQFVGFLDLDCTYPIKSLVDLHSQISLNPELDVIIANRMTKWSKMPPLRALGNWIYIFLIALVYRKKLKDACSGMRLFRSRLLTTVLKLENNGLGFSIEMTCRMLLENWAYQFVAIIYNERSGPSKLNIVTDGFSFLNQIFNSKRIQYDKT